MRWRGDLYAGFSPPLRWVERGPGGEVNQAIVGNLRGIREERL
jgi:hypothetical protein